MARAPIASRTTPLPDMFQPGLLQILGDISHVFVGNGARLERRHRAPDRVQHHRRPLHFVKGESVLQPAIAS